MEWSGTRMKVKTIELHLTKKLPIEGIQYSNKEAGYHITVEIEKGEEIDHFKLWEKIKDQVAIGLDEEEQGWLMGSGEGKKENGK